MRALVFGVCLFMAACSGQGVDSPTSPMRTTVAGAPGGYSQAQAHSAADLPFRGSFTLATSGVLNCPPTCPPTTLRVTGSQEGTATQLGRFSATSLDVVDLVPKTSTGTFNFTAANGDRLFTKTAGGEDGFIQPNISHVTLVATIVGGTGRFAGATGIFTMQSTATIDFASGTSSGSGSFEGHINLND